jgi:hypothetical protein
LKTGLIVLALLNISLFLPHLAVHATASIPARTDDGLDPVNLIFTGYAPAWWVAQNLNGWNPTLCSLPKTLDGKNYNFTLETPNTISQSPACWGPRYHIRIWDMGTDPVFGHWSIGAVHHEHSECAYIIYCHHVVDGWENAEALARSTFLDGTSALSVINYRLNNAGLFQGIINDGNATLIQLSPPHRVTFAEAGLRPGTSWSATLNGQTLSNSSSTIRFFEPNGTYTYNIGTVAGYNLSAGTGSLSVQGSDVQQSAVFTSAGYAVTFVGTGLPAGTGWSVTLNGKTIFSVDNTIVFVQPQGTYSYTIGSVQGYGADPSSGSIIVAGNSSKSVRFTPTRTIESVLGQSGVLSFLLVTIVAWVLVFVTAAFVKFRKRTVGE